jgi:hypothetical protein
MVFVSFHAIDEFPGMIVNSVFLRWSVPISGCLRREDFQGGTDMPSNPPGEIVGRREESLLNLYPAIKVSEYHFR